VDKPEREEWARSSRLWCFGVTPFRQSGSLGQRRQGPARPEGARVTKLMVGARTSAAVILTLLGWAALALIAPGSVAPQGSQETIMVRPQTKPHLQAAAPPLDAVAPLRLETATFALG